MRRRCCPGLQLEATNMNMIPLHRTKSALKSGRSGLEVEVTKVNTKQLDRTPPGSGGQMRTQPPAFRSQCMVFAFVEWVFAMCSYAL